MIGFCQGNAVTHPIEMPAFAHERPVEEVAGVDLHAGLIRQ